MTETKVAPRNLKTPHTAIFSFPFASHHISLLSVARKIAASTPAIAVSFFGTSTSNKFLGSISDSLGDLHNLNFYDVPDGIPTNDVVAAATMKDRVSFFLKAAPGNLKEALEVAVAESGPVTCVLTDTFLWCAGEVAEEMGVPWVSLRTGGILSLSVHYYTEMIRREIGVGHEVIATRGDQHLDFIPGLSSLRARDLPEGVIIEDSDDPVLYLLGQISKKTPSTTPLVVNTFEGLDPEILADLKTKFKTVLPIGPLNLFMPLPHGPDSYGSLTWLDQFKPNSVAYIGFGTMVELDPADVAALANGLEASGAPFLWSLKGDKILPKGFLERTKGKGLVVPWVPQLKVLEHVAVGAHITHCGYNSLMDTIVGGVPLICRPYYNDQKINRRVIILEWQIGIDLESVVAKHGIEAISHVREGALTREGVMAALDLVLNKEEGRKMRERVVALKEIATRAVGPQGSSTENFNNLLSIVSTC